ncbi:MAG: ABC transporter ATP-binding protein, partial [Solirubrobacterales bacterium]
MTDHWSRVTDDAPALRFEAFSYSYPNAGAEGLAGLSLTVEPGAFVLVCGRSGSGKSTLLRAASGLIPHHFGGVAGGEAFVCGRDLRTNGAAELSAVCGTVLQDPEVQIVMGGVRHEIAFPLENLGWPPAEVRVAVEETALALGIHELLDRRTAELSAGELQRVVLAAALAARPRLLVLDEPTSQLDPVVADELLATLRRLNADWGTTILIAEHRIERLIEFADRVIVFEDGRVAHDSEPAGFLGWAAETASRRWLLTPTARMFAAAGLRPLPVGAKQARRILGSPPVTKLSGGEEGPRAAVRDDRGVALALERVTHTYGAAPNPALDGVSLRFALGERVALMGANGSGKSTLLRVARSLVAPTTGTVAAAGSVGLLMQNPNDYLIHERVADEAPLPGLRRFGLGELLERDPRDLSGGERQRLALAIVTQDDPVALLLDEPTRGMDREHKADLAELLRELADSGIAIVVATHDSEFAAEFARRVVLLGGGRVLADAPAREI